MKTMPPEPRLQQAGQEPETMKSPASSWRRALLAPGLALAVLGGLVGSPGAAAAQSVQVVVSGPAVRVPPPAPPRVVVQQPPPVVVVRPAPQVVVAPAPPPPRVVVVAPQPQRVVVPAQPVRVYQPPPPEPFHGHGHGHGPGWKHGHGWQHGHEGHGPGPGWKHGGR